MSMEVGGEGGVDFLCWTGRIRWAANSIEGPVEDARPVEIYGVFWMPMIYGMTMGELAKMFNAENKIGADLIVVEMRGWKREDYFEETGVKWVDAVAKFADGEGDAGVSGAGHFAVGGCFGGAGDGDAV